MSDKPKPQRATTSSKNRDRDSPPPYRSQAETTIEDFVQEFWQHALNVAEHHEDDFKHQALPLARIKKVAKMDPEVQGQMISSEVTVLFEKACQIFIQELTARAHLVSLAARRRTLSRADVAQAVSRSDMFDFLIDIVPRNERTAAASTSAGGSNAPGGPSRRKRRAGGSGFEVAAPAPVYNDSADASGSGAGAGAAEGNVRYTDPNLIVGGAGDPDEDDEDEGEADAQGEADEDGQGAAKRFRMDAGPSAQGGAAYGLPAGAQGAEGLGQQQQAVQQAAMAGYYGLPNQYGAGAPGLDASNGQPMQGYLPQNLNQWTTTYGFDPTSTDPSMGAYYHPPHDQQAGTNGLNPAGGQQGL
ncbi:hypothetical protein JCM10207_005610 [Rhodosporidiobolus poonsookiae]